MRVFFRFIFSAKNLEVLGLEWGMIPQVSSIICPDQISDVKCQYEGVEHNMMPYLTQKRLKILQILSQTTHNGG